MIFIDDEDVDFPSGLAPATKDHGENTEEDDRQNEAQRERAAVAA